MSLPLGTNRVVQGLAVLTALIGALLLETPAVAGIAGSDTPTWPGSAVVGQLIQTSVLIGNASTTPNDTENVTLTQLFVTPACKDGTVAICLSPNEDPGVFKVISAVGDPGFATCANVAFTVGGANPTTGEVLLTPTSTITLGSTASGTNLTCQVNLTLRVLKVPENPAPGPPVTTDPLTRATLHGVDSGLNGGASGAAQIQIGKGDIIMSTTADQNGILVTPGSPVTDTLDISKVVAAAVAPTGTVTFFLCQPSEVTVAGCPDGKGTMVGAPIAFAGVGQIQSDASTNTTAIGTYCWRAQYSGDANYNPQSHTNVTTECFATQSLAPNVVTQSSPSGGNQSAGVSVSDTVTVTGGAGQPTPTGTVVFFLCQPNQMPTPGLGCLTGGNQVGAAKTLVNGQATSDATTNTNTPGKYCWRAEYSGDSAYSAASHTDGTAECFRVKATPPVTTTSSTTAANVVPGASVTDAATVAPVAAGATPTGTVTFFLCQPATVTANGGDCSAGGTQVGAAKALNGSGQATSDATTNTTAIGKYCWRAEYSGDSLYLPASHTNSTTECFTTVKQPSTTATASSPTGGNQTPGVSVTDAVTVTGGSGQPTPTGTVTFFLCQPATVTANGGDCSSGGSQVGAVKALSASGQATSDATTNTTAIGKYCWRAAYSGDSFYDPSSHTNSTTECFTTVKQPSTTATTSNPTGDQAPGVSVTDSATVTGVAGQPTPTGTVTFFLCQPAEVTASGCPSGGTQVGVVKALNVSGQATSDSTNNTNTIGKYCWRAEYSGDSVYASSSHTNSTTECFTTIAVEALCKSPGYWGNHVTVTQLVLDAAMAKVGGPLTICGQTVDNTTVPDQQSAIEAICVKGGTAPANVTHVARNLMATVLSCVATEPGGGPTTVCAGQAISDLFEACNAACASQVGTGNKVTVTINNQEIECQSALDDYVNGNGCNENTSVIGVCETSGDLCSDNIPCPQGDQCSETSADPTSCKAARGNDCTIFGGC